jgi:hypothetical protein
MTENKNLNNSVGYSNAPKSRESASEASSVLNIVTSDIPSLPTLNKDEIQKLINSLNSSNISSFDGNKDLYSDINNKLDAISKLLDNNTITSTDSSLNADLEEMLKYVTTINSLKLQINELPFSPFERIYVENCINPLLTIFYQLAISAASFKDTAQSLSLSTTTKRKTHKIKKYERTTYEIMDQINCIHGILEHRIYDFIEIICKCK